MSASGGRWKSFSTNARTVGVRVAPPTRITPSSAGFAGSSPASFKARRTGAAVRGVAAGRFHLEHPAGQLEDRDVEGPAAEVVDREGALRPLVEPVGERGRGRLVEQAQHFEAGEPPRVAGGLALRVVEIRRD